MGRLRDHGWLVTIVALACDPVARAPAPTPVAAAHLAPAPAPGGEQAARGEKPGKPKQPKQKQKQQKPGKIARERPAKGKAARQPDAPRPSPPSPAAPGGPPLPPCPPDNVLTWRSFGAGFLLTWCTGCHSSALAEDARQGAPLAVDFDTYAAYKPFERLVHERAVTEAHAIALDPAAAASPMPPAGLVPEADRRRLAQWIACGSPAPH